MTNQDENTTPETFTADQMAEVRNEAKTWRKKLREAETERDQLRTQVQELSGERDAAIEARDTATAERDSLKAAGELAEITREIATANGLPTEALRGTTREELEAHAAVLKPVYAKATGAYAPNIGDRPETTSSEVAQFAVDLFAS